MLQTSRDSKILTVSFNCFVLKLENYSTPHSKRHQGIDVSNNFSLTLTLKVLKS